MASISKRVASALQKEFVEGTVFRVDLDHVDVAPAGSSGILRSLPLTGDRDKIKPGDLVRIINVAGERVALAGDVATSDVPGEIVEDASMVALAERLQNLNVGPNSLDETATSSGNIDAYSLQGLLPAESGADAHVVLSDVDGVIHPDGIITPNLTVATAAAIQTATIISAEVTGNLLVDSALTVNGKITAGANTNLAGPTCGLVYMVDGGGAVVTTGDKGFVSFPVAMHISNIKTLNNASSTTTCAIYKSTYATYGTWTLLSSSIGSTTALKNSQAVNWDLQAGDIIYVNVTACSAANKFSLVFEGYRT